MAQLACDWMFNLGGVSWVETHHIEKDTPEEALDAMKTVHPSRMGMMGKGPYLFALRVSDVDIDGDALLVNQNVERTNQSNPAHDNPYATWLCEMQSQNLYGRSFDLAGLPDSWTNYSSKGGVVQRNNDFDRKFGIWRGQMIAQGFGIRAMSRNAVVAPETRITSLAVGASGLLQITTAADLGLQQLDEVNLRKIPKAQFNGLQGRLRVIEVIDSNNFTVNANPNNYDLTAYNTRGVCKKVVWLVNGYDEIALKTPDKRNLGKVLGSRRGRRRTAR